MSSSGLPVGNNKVPRCGHFRLGEFPLVNKAGPGH